jgi:hypothetical protein
VEGFVYRDAQSELSLTFRWDGAGLSSSGDIILFEEEKPPFQSVHIHGHLSRLLLMIRAGEPVTKLIWIVPDRWYSELDRIVFPYLRIWENGLGIRFPSIEYRNENGACLGFLGIRVLSSRRLFDRLDLLSSTPGITVVVGFPFTASHESPCASEARSLVLAGNGRTSTAPSRP